MNKTLYNTAMEKIIMSDECEARIMEAVNNAEQVTVKRHKKIRFAPVLAAAAVLTTCTVGVAAESGGFEWIRGFFTKNNFEMTNDVTDIIADINNFTCESDMGIELSPVGMIGDETTLYCMFNVESFPEDIDHERLHLNRFYTGSVPSFDELLSRNSSSGEKYTREDTVNSVVAEDESDTEMVVEDVHTEYVEEDNATENALTAESVLSEEEYENGMSCGWQADYDEENNIVIFKMETSYKGFNDGDNVTLELCIAPEKGSFFSGDPNNDMCAKLNFDIKFGDMKTLEVNYDEYNAVEVYNTKFFIENMKITPLKVNIVGTELYHDSMTMNNDLTFIMKDKSIVTASHNGFSSSTSIKKPHNKVVSSDWTFGSPVNPENITAVYLDELCLYSVESAE